MTTSQASRIFGIPYNSLLMYVRGKYGKSLKLEQLRKDCISGPPLELLQMGVNSSSSNASSKNSSETREQKEARKEAQRNNSSTSGGDMDMVCGPMTGSGPRSSSSEPDLLGGPNALFNPFNPQGFYPEFPGGFPGLPLSMLNLLPPSERQHAAAAAAAMHHSMVMDEDCKSDRSKQSSSMDDEFSISRDERHRHNELMQANNTSASSLSQQNGAVQDWNLWRDWANNPLIFPPPENNGFDQAPHSQPALPPPPPPHHSEMNAADDSLRCGIGRGTEEGGDEEKDHFRPHIFKEFNQNLYMARKKLRRYRKKHLKLHDVNPNMDGHNSYSSKQPMDTFMGMQPPMSAAPPVVRT